MAAVSDDASSSKLLVGLGSPHQQDQIGWHIATWMERLALPGLRVRRALVPLDILDWIEGYSAVHVVDAMLGGDEALRCWRWPGCHDLQRQGGSTHGFDIVSVLELASTLGMLPEEVVVWGVSERFIV